MAINKKIIPVERFSTITAQDQFGNTVMSFRFADFIEALTAQVNQNIPLAGAGTPEASVTAEPYRLYLDTAAAAGSNLYIKKTGSGDTGWQLT